MSTAVIILIAVGALAILVALYLASRRQAEQRREDKRLIATEHRDEAERNRLDAAKESAIADEEAAAARRQAAEAEQRAHSAQIAQLQADAHEEHAQEIDPDVSDTEYVNDTADVNDTDGDDRDFDERHEMLDGEREGRYTGERPPVSDSEPSRRSV